jgi:GTP-binding protein EngB required for normal cell division
MSRPPSCQLSLRKFNPRDIPFDPNKSQGPTIVLVGRRGTGKSELIKDILYYHQDHL